MAWWIMRPIENCIDNKVNHKDGPQSIESQDNPSGKRM